MSKTIWKILACVFAAAAIVLALLYFIPSQPKTASSQSSESYTIQIHLFNGTTEQLKCSSPQELSELLAGYAVPAGWYSSGWADENGTLLKLEELNSEMPPVLYQNCRVLLQDSSNHPSFAFPEENGAFLLERPVQRKDIALMFGTLLVDEDADTYAFADVSAEDAWNHGASLMHYYGMVFGNRFYPEETLTYGELYYYLSFCFSKAVQSYRFDDIDESDDYYPAVCTAAELGWLNTDAATRLCHASETVSFKNYISILNYVLARSSRPEQIPVEVKAYLRDYSADPQLLCDLADAAVAHSSDAVNGNWTAFSISSKLEPGFHFENNRLSYVDDTGTYIVNSSYHGFLFDENGYYTSGNAELDTLVQSILDEILTDEMTQEEQLKAVYKYTVNNFGIGGAYDYDWGTDDWWIESALMMFQRGRGNCYSFAAAFCALSRPLGYFTRVTSGQTFGAGTHGWAYIFFDGEEHIFDPQSENRYHRNMFDMSPKRWKSFEYDPVYSSDAETPSPILK